MKPTYYSYLFLLFFICSSTFGFAQKGKTLIGIQTGNNLSIPGNSNEDGLNETFLLRYSIGFLASTTFVEGADFIYLNMLPVRDGIFTFDYGLNFVFNGYHYEFEDFVITYDNLSIEIPLLVNFYDQKSVFSPRGWRRKGMASFGRLGLKTSFNLGNNRNQELTDSNGSFREALSYRKFNVLSSLSLGILQSRKNGNKAGVEIAANVGLLNLVEGKVEWLSSQSGNFSETSFLDKGSYISINAFYLFDAYSFLASKFGKEEPVLFNPRF